MKQTVKSKPPNQHGGFFISLFLQSKQKTNCNYQKEAKNMKSNQTPANKRAVPQKKNKVPSNSKHAPKPFEEKFEIKHEIAIRLRKGQNRNRVYESMVQDGFNISANTVYAYARQIHEEWVKFKNDSYELHIAKQLAMLDLMIERCWLILDKSEKDAVKTNVEYEMIYDDKPKESSEEDTSDENPKGVGAKSEGSETNPKGRKNATPTEQNPKGKKRMVSEKIERAGRDGDIEVLKMLEKFWLRRCEILGISLNTTINIQNNQFNETTNIQANIHKPVSNQFFRSVVIEEDIRKGIQEADAEVVEDNQE